VCTFSSGIHGLNVLETVVYLNRRDPINLESFAQLEGVWRYVLHGKWRRWNGRGRGRGV